MKTRMMGAVALSLLTAACGTNSTERTTGGAAAGAATGAGIGAFGGPVGALAGAGIGGAAGAVTGATTSPQDVNLGRPLWADPEVRVPGGRNSGSSGRSSASASSGETRQLQQALAQRGFDPGPVDGVMGPRTRQAVTDWQRQNNMDATGRPNAQMYSSLGITPASTSGGSRTAQNERDRAYMGGGMVGGSQSQSTGSSTGSIGTSSGGNTGANTGTVGSGAAGGRSGLSGQQSPAMIPSGPSGSLPRTDGQGGVTQGSRTTVEQNPDTQSTNR